MLSSETFLEGEECTRCSTAIATARRLGARITCDCGAEYVPIAPSHERALQALLSDAETMARWAPYYRGRAIDYDRSRAAPSEQLTVEEQERREASREQERARARLLFARLDALRSQAERTVGAEPFRAVAVITWLVERCGSERTKGHRVGGEVVAPKLSRLVGETFADPATKARARGVPYVAPKPPSEAPPKPPPTLVLSDDPEDGPRLRAQERLAHEVVEGRYVVEGLVWLLRRLLHAHAVRVCQRTNAEIRSDAESARTEMEEHGAELLRDAAWLWSEGERPS